MIGPTAGHKHLLVATHFTGGCTCGGARYSCTAEAVFAVNCHCRDCQRATGSAFASMFFVPQDAVTITGDVKYHEVVGDSGKVVKRGFCPTCGARLFSKPSRDLLLADLLGIAAGSLDDPSPYRPTMDIYVTSAQPWDCMDPELPKFRTFPQA